ncbi:xanthine dehydrogenase family protein subunit M [bacterium]|nr:MAG: xanthine dehydrogenase family protein subunit M [bacterium]
MGSTSEMMFRTDYVAPESLEELLAVLHQHGREAKVIAGGTDLIPQMRAGQQSPKMLIDPHRLPLAGISQANGGIRLGAHFTHTQALTSLLLQREYPALVGACRQIGGPPVRNRGTLAGNLANASPAADSAPPLLAYDAQIVAARLDGERVIPLDEFFLDPGQTRLAGDEFIREIRIPKMPPRTTAVFLKLGKRQAMAIAVASVALRLSLDEAGHVTQARIALGSVAPTPMRAFQAEAILQSNPLNEETLRLAAQAARQAASPISDLRASAGYRGQMVAVLVRRALEMICKELAQGNSHG